MLRLFAIYAPQDDHLSDHDSYIDDMMLRVKMYFLPAVKKNGREPEAISSMLWLSRRQLQLCLCLLHLCLSAPTSHTCASQPAALPCPALPFYPQGEPELSGEMGAEPAEPAEVAKPPPPSRAQLALAPAAAVAATARGALAAASTQLCALAASVSAYLARIVPAGADVAQRVVLGLAEVVGSLRVSCLLALVMLVGCLCVSGGLPLPWCCPAACFALRVSHSALALGRRQLGDRTAFPWRPNCLSMMQERFVGSGMHADCTLPSRPSICAGALCAAGAGPAGQQRGRGA